MFLDGFSGPEHVGRERARARELRKSLWWRQQVGRGVCHYCNGKFAVSDLTMDHVLPVARGGRSSKNNVVPACHSCNQDKGHLFTVEKVFAELDAKKSPTHSTETNSNS